MFTSYIDKRFGWDALQIRTPHAPAGIQTSDNLVRSVVTTLAMLSAVQDTAVVNIIVTAKA